MSASVPTALTLLVAVLIPTLAAMLGILFSRQDLARLEGKIGQLEAKIDRQGEALHLRIDRLAESVHEDIKQLIDLHHETDVRIARLEERRS